MEVLLWSGLSFGIGFALAIWLSSEYVRWAKAAWTAQVLELLTRRQIKEDAEQVCRGEYKWN
jgi:hypothetical protein